MTTLYNTLWNDNVSTPEKLIILIAPWAIFAANYLWPSSSNDGKLVTSRPPPYFFGVAWTTIVIGLILSWLMLSTITLGYTRYIVHGMYILVIGLAVNWQYTYYQNNSNLQSKINGVYALWGTVLGSLMLTITSIILVTQIIHKTDNYYLLLAPLLLSILCVWGIYASVMNMIEVQELSKL